MTKKFTVGNPDRTALRAALAAAALIMVMQIAGKATRDSLFLAGFEVRHLPKAMIAAAILSLMGVLLVSRAMARVGPAGVLKSGLKVTIALYLIEWLLAGPYPRLISVIVYLHVSAFGAILISALWGVFNERFNPYTAKLGFGNVAAAMTFGGVLGGLLAQRIGGTVGLSAVLPALAIVGVTCLGSLRLVVKEDDGPGRDTAVEPPPLLESLLELPFVRLMALLVGTTAVAETLIDYALKAEAASRFAGEQQLISFFSLFYAAVSVLAFVVQATVGRKAVGRLGVGATLAIQPVIMIVTGTLAAVTLRLWAVVLMRASQSVLANSVFRPAFEQLYTPIPRPQKRPSKIVIDVGAQRLGDLLGSGLLVLVLLVTPAFATRAAIVTAVGAGVVALFLMRRLYRGYVTQLASNLSEGVQTVGKNEPGGVPTYRAWAERGSERLRGRLHRDRDDGQFLKSAQTILAGDPAQILPILANRPLDPRLAAPVIPLLAHPDLSESAERALYSAAPQLVGQLADAFLDARTPLGTRLRVPWLLLATDSELAPQVLLKGLEDKDFGVRYRCGQALSQLVRSDVSLRLDRDLLNRLVRQELKAEADEWPGREAVMRKLQEEPHPGPTGPDEGPLASFSHVFNMLSLVHDARIIKLAILGLGSHDEALRGTALEYLANVLPERLFDQLAVHLRDAGR